VRGATRLESDPKGQLSLAKPPGKSTSNLETEQQQEKLPAAMDDMARKLLSVRSLSSL
jgi:hypothetical protein